MNIHEQYTLYDKCLKMCCVHTEEQAKVALAYIDIARGNITDTQLRLRLLAMEAGLVVKVLACEGGAGGHDYTDAAGFEEHELKVGGTE